MDTSISKDVRIPERTGTVKTMHDFFRTQADQSEFVNISDCNLAVVNRSNSLQWVGDKKKMVSNSPFKQMNGRVVKE